MKSNSSGFQFRSQKPQNEDFVPDIAKKPGMKSGYKFGSQKSQNEEFEDHPDKPLKPGFSFKSQNCQNTEIQDRKISAPDLSQESGVGVNLDKSAKYKPKPFQAPNKIEEPSDPIDAYFAQMQRKNPVYARERPNPDAKIK